MDRERHQTGVTGHSVDHVVTFADHLDGNRSGARCILRGGDALGDLGTPRIGTTSANRGAELTGHDERIIAGTDRLQ